MKTLNDKQTLTLKSHHIAIQKAKRRVQLKLRPT